MVVLDISIPTGFVPVVDSVAGVVEREKTIKRYEVAGRKVIFYIENMFAGERISFSFDVQAMCPVRAKGVTSRVYSYYKPEISGETLGEGVVKGASPLYDAHCHHKPLTYSGAVSIHSPGHFCLIYTGKRRKARWRDYDETP